MGDGDDVAADRKGIDARSSGAEGDAAPLAGGFKDEGSTRAAAELLQGLTRAPDARGGEWGVIVGRRFRQLCEDAVVAAEDLRPRLPVDELQVAANWMVIGDGERQSAIVRGGDVDAPEHRLAVGAADGDLHRSRGGAEGLVRRRAGADV